jgi:hypothetical protein
MSTGPSQNDAEAAKLLEEFRRLTPGERLALRMASKAETKKAKREQRKHEESAVYERSLDGTRPVGDLHYWSEQTGISPRELRRLASEGLLEVSQLQAGAKGSTLRIPRAAIVDLLRRMAR